MVAVADSKNDVKWTEAQLLVESSYCRCRLELKKGCTFGKITSLSKFGLNWSSKLRENDERKNTLVRRICVLSDNNKRLLAKSLLLFKWELTSFSTTTLLQRESFLTMFYIINSSPMLVTKSIFVLILSSSNYQYCPVSLSDNGAWLDRYWPRSYGSLQFLTECKHYQDTYTRNSDGQNDITSDISR